MPHNSTRAKPSKTKKLSLKRVLRSKDKADKQDNMDTEPGYKITNFFIINRTEANVKAS